MPKEDLVEVKSKRRGVAHFGVRKRSSGLSSLSPSVMANFFDTKNSIPPSIWRYNIGCHGHHLPLLLLMEILLFLSQKSRVHPVPLYSMNSGYRSLRIPVIHSVG